MSTPDFLIDIVQGMADIGMIFAPCLGYMVQTYTMFNTGTAQGFSPYVSFILISSNLIRLFWWYLDRFSWVILGAAILMVICQIILVFFWVKLNNRQRTMAMQLSKSNEEDNLGEFQNAFWHWNSFSYYVATVSSMIIILTLFSWLGSDSKIYAEGLGLLSSGIEALLGVPQFWLNFGRRNTYGLSLTLILLWLLGDLYKMSYYQQTEAPVQLLMCACFQVCTDIAIISQFWIYREQTAKIVKDRSVQAHKHQKKIDEGSEYQGLAADDLSRHLLLKAYGRSFTGNTLLGEPSDDECAQDDEESDLETVNDKPLMETDIAIDEDKNSE